MDQSQVECNKKFHMWTPEEDNLLVECLVNLRTEQKFMAENGFKPGFANALQLMMKEKAPGCGIKASPHIMSRIKTLKIWWQAVYDMVYGTNTSGFGWDPDTKCVTAEKEVWDEYLKVHTKAAPFRKKSFVHLESLSFVWAKDRAVGDIVRSPVGMEEEVGEEELNGHSPENVPEVELISPVLETATTTVPNTEASSSTRKRRKTNNSDILADVIRESVTSLDSTIVNVIENLGNRISTQAQARQAAIDAKG